VQGARVPLLAALGPRVTGVATVYAGYSCLRDLQRFSSYSRPYTREAVGEGPMNQEINNGAVQVLRDYTGRGPTKARSVIDRDSVTILLADTLTPGERRLADAGKADRVLETRHEFQQLMRDDLVKVVEDALDRKVIAFMSTNHIDPDMAVEVFVLEPKAE
jgi:uncharacterized protein YbcI